MKRPVLAAVLACAAVCSAQAQQRFDAAPEPSAEELAWQREQLATSRSYDLRLADALAAGGGARELAFAAFLRRQADFTAAAMSAPGNGEQVRPAPADAKVEGWRRTAAAKAGDDVIANQLLLHLAGDPDADGTLAPGAARRWQQAEPGNLAPLLHQGLAVEDVLGAARRASFVDQHMYDTVRWIASVYRRHPWNAQERGILGHGGSHDVEEMAAISATAIWAAIAMPAYARLTEACRGNALDAAPQRRADCRNVATLLADRSDTAFDRSIGLSLLREVAVGNAELASVDARMRRMDWQMQRWGEVAANQERDGAAQYVRLLNDESIRTEQQMMERVLHEAGVQFDPPGNWTSPWRQ